MPSKIQKEFPTCTVLLCCGALFCHSLTYMGNMHTVSSVRDMGKSVSGWSKVGLAVADTLHEELDGLLSNASFALTDAINKTMETQELIDSLMSQMGDQSNDLLLIAVRNASFLHVSGALVGNPMDQVMKVVMGMLGALPNFQAGLGSLQGMLENVKPVLLQVGIWVETFADKVQATIETFGTTLDRIQKIFDKLMTQFSPDAGKNAPEMEHETFNLFDTDGSGALSEDDLRACAQSYGVDALRDDKAGQLIQVHDANGDGEVDTQEFSTFVADQSIIGIMATVLRAYAKRLSQVGGQVGAGRMRDEVASSVIGYFQLVCSKNLTKVGWIAEMLTNGTLPMPFTADVMAELALQKDDPNVLTTTDIGEVVIGMMMILNKEYSLECLDLMADPEHWVSEGFEPEDQAACVQQVVAWSDSGPDVVHKLMEDRLEMTAKEPEATLSAGENIIDDDDDNDTDGAFDANLLRRVMFEMPAAAGKLAARRMKDLSVRKHRKRMAKRMELFGTPQKQTMLRELLHGVAATDGGSVDRAMQALSKGVPAVPETLLFAQWLKANATRDAKRFQQMCFEYTGESSGALEAFNTQIQGMVKQLSGFIDIMKKYATVAGIERLEDTITNFASTAMKDVFEIISAQILNALEEKGPVDEEGADFHVLEKRRILMQLPSAARSALTKAAQAPPPGVSTVWEEVSNLLREFEQVLPTAIDLLKFGRQEVSAVSAQMESIFSTLNEKGEPIFQRVALLYFLVWTMYYFLCAPFVICVLFYGFWASGWFGGPTPSNKPEEEDYEAPTGCLARCKCCVKACCDCVVSCHEYKSVFWSFILLFQVIVLLFFMATLIFVLIAGVQIFLGSSCAQIVLLGDKHICHETLSMLSTFLSTFQVDSEVPLSLTCKHYNLLTCDLIRNKMLSSALMTMIGSILAVGFSFQLIFEMAIIHERYRWRKVINEMEVNVQTKGKAS
eukprot:TRINITY_DN54592_c0_g1_i1.p1 TRINITY_DN54592_c0_g1~~TRINITY_DN54592_c0_g1_i1.p1  ORF type:complete len:987 (-),score=209.70 TRINITY_DN54592_c0_g1_i1:115-2985(-)